MKKLFLTFVLLMNGCSMAESEYIMQEIESDIVYVETEEELVKYLDDNLMKGIDRVRYQSDRDLDMDEVIRMLSYLNPFDLKLKKYRAENEEGACFIMEVEYMDEEYLQTMEKAMIIKGQIIEDTMSQREKVDAIHQYILDTCEYNMEITERTEQNEHAFQAYGVFFEHHAVCTGYSRAFLLLLRLCEVPCLYVPSDAMNHSFNLLYDDAYRYVDVTWDDNEGKYYGLSIDAFFADGKHYFDPDYDHEYFMKFLSYIYELK